MKRFLYVCLVLIGVGVLVSCKTQKAVTVTFSDLDGEWNIVELNGKAVKAIDGRPFILFDIPRKTLSGNAGCNRIMGNIEYNDTQKNIIKFPKIAATRMACPDMDEEREVLQTLDKIVRFEPEGVTAPVTKIAFYGTDNTKLMVIEKKL